MTNALETEIRDWHRTEDALVFSGCYVANVETLSTLLGRHFPGAQCFSDAGNHRSMIEGIRKGKMEQQDPKNRAFIFRHDDPVHLEELLSREYAKGIDQKTYERFWCNLKYCKFCLQTESHSLSIKLPNPNFSRFSTTKKPHN